MRVLFIVPYPTEGPSNRFRVEQYLSELEKCGIGYIVRPFCNSGFYKTLFQRQYNLKKTLYLMLFSVLRVMDVVRSLFFDVVFIHREAFPTKDFLFEWLFKLFGKKIIYDFDDSIFLKKPAKVKKTITISDCVITGNKFLKDYASKLNDNAVVIPTSIDTDKYKPASSQRADNRIVIGWIGTPTTASYLLEIKEVFKVLAEKYENIEFRVIGAEFATEKSLPIAYEPWSLHSEVKDLQGFDIGIMPMPDNDWTKGKCAFKIIQYMAVGIPAVASPCGMNTEVISDGVNGFLPSNDKEWCDRLALLIESPELRIKLGENGRKMIEKQYSVKANTSKFIDILKNCSMKGAN